MVPAQPEGTTLGGMTGRSSLAIVLTLVASCAESNESGSDARVRMPADLGDISERGCATGTDDLRTLGFEGFIPFCSLETRDCVDGCAGDRICESGCVDADPTRSIFPSERSGCAMCFGLQRNACLTELCPDVVAELTCCIDDYAECASDHGCSPCGDRWDAFDACLAASECRELQDFCFVQP